MAEAVEAAVEAAAPGEAWRPSMWKTLLSGLRRLRILSALFDTRPLSSPNERRSGTPTSTNRASSFHLRWELPTREPIVSISATLEVLNLPAVDRLYFWALQATFSDARQRFGGAHLGLQFHPAYPGSTAVNWGGYDSSGRELSGTESALSSSLRNANTRDYDWAPNRQYRLTIEPAPSGGWRGSIVDLATGTQTVIRDLTAPGDRLISPVMWSEVFADCDHPSVSVRWSDLQAVTTSGETLTPTSVITNYQTVTDGGCSNTNSHGETNGLVQTTNTERVTPQGVRIET